MPDSALRDAGRLRAARRAMLLTSASAAPFDRVARLACAVLRAPTALLTLVGDEQDGRIGRAGVPGVPGDDLLRVEAELPPPPCWRVVDGGAPVVVDDLARHADFAALRSVREHGVRAYVGVPLVDAAGRAIGSLCVVDTAPRAWDAAAVEALTELAAMATTEVALCERTELLGALAGNAPDTIARLDLDGRYVYVNPAVQVATGMPPEAILGRTHAELGAPAGRTAMWDATIARVATTGRPQQLTLELESPAGALSHDVRVAPEFDERGAVISVLAVGRDVTEQRRAEAALRASESALRESEARYRLMFERNPLPMWVFESGTYAILAVNQAAVTHYGYTRAEFMAMTVVELRPPEDREGFLRRPRSDRVKGHAFAGVRHLHKDGRVVEVEVISNPIDFAGAEAWLVMANDVTARRQAEESARASAALLSTVIEGTTDTVFAKDRQGRYLLMNAAGAAVAGRTPAEVVGLTDAELFAPGHVSELAAHDREVIETGTAVTYETTGDLVVPAVGGTSPNSGRVFLTTKTPFRRADGEVDGVIGISRDITKQKRLEAQVRQAQKMEALGQLAGGVAHDFNNLLTVITSYGELALAALPAGDPVRGDVEEIKGAAVRAAQLTRQLLAFSRKQVLQPRVLDVNAVVSGAERLLTRLIGADVELVTMLAGSLGSVRADPGQVEQVIVNLAVNARDAMPDGGVLFIETADVVVGPAEAGSARRPGLVPGAYVALTVRDTGVGIDATTLPRVFEPFFTTKAIGEGTGLGLSTVYGIVKQSGGYVYADSTPGIGTAFVVLLPRVAGDADDDARPAQRASALPAGTETVLLAEDEAAVRAVAARLLRAQGYTVLEAADGLDALRVAERAEGPVALLLTDLVMPGLGGRALAERLGAQRPGLRAMFMSGYSAEVAAPRGALPAGATFLQKPFTPDALVKKVRAALDA